MSAPRTESLQIDAARDWLIEQMATLLGEGARQVRIRVSDPDGDSPDCSLYRFKGHSWIPTNISTSDHALSLSIYSIAQMLGSHPPAEDWQARRHEAEHYADTDLSFNQDRLDQLRADQLPEWLRGTLFLDATSVPHSRRCRTPPRQPSDVDVS